MFDICCVVGCKTTKDANRDLSFHKFPQLISEELRTEIIEAIGRRNDASFNSAKATICSRHFSPDCFILITGSFPGRRLRKDCFPTLNLPSTPRSDSGRSSKKDDVPVISEAEPSTASPELAVDSTDSPVTDSDILSKFTDEEILLELSQRQNLFVCACGMVFQDRALYYLHRSCHNPVQTNKCAVCGFESNDWLAFHAHFFRHTNDSEMEEVVEID